MSKPTFEHRHYVAIAEIIASMPKGGRELAADHFSRELRGTNPRFDRERFLAAAMGKPSGRDRC